MTTARSFGVVLFCIVLSLVLLNNAALPFVWIGLIWFADCLLLAKTARCKAAKVLWFNLGFVWALIVVGEMWFATPGGTVHAIHKTYSPGGYLVPNALLGYSPRPGTRVGVVARCEGEQVYAVEYKIDASGLRAVSKDGGQRSGSIIFFGGSFTFGEGLPNEDTLPYIVSQGRLSKYACYNFGTTGYGPHQMLAAIQGNLVQDLVNEAPKHVVYQLIPDHVRRAAGLSTWDQNGPRYVLDDRANVVRRGNFNPWVVRALGAMRKSKILARHDWPAKVGAEQVNLTLAIIDQSRRIVHERYPDCRFHVIFWDHVDSKLTTQIQLALAERAIVAYSIRDILPGIEKDISAYVLSEHDLHPNAHANRLIASYLEQHLME